ncbi:hypothetical protein Syun_028031 [Stephania yunnanensis]|uniref:Uncharacterized protein n=1 Tax=Stephania yunnanensis TaxID=152371 RepID=A0AAP0HRS7_9MAGN
MPKSVKHGKQSLFLSKDFALDTEGSMYSDSSSIPKDGFSRLPFPTAQEIACCVFFA